MEVGDDLDLTCAISGPGSETLNASDLFFYDRRVKYSVSSQPSVVTVLSQSATRYRIPNITMNHTQASVVCRLDGELELTVTSEHLIVASKYFADELICVFSLLSRLNRYMLKCRC